MKRQIGAQLVTDDTRQCAEGVFFVVTGSNAKYQEQARTAKATLISPEELWAMLPADMPKVVGITGTNGKTTTAAAIYSGLLDLGYRAALLGTRGFYSNDRQLAPKGLTTPMLLETVDFMLKARDEGCDFFVMEVSSHAIDQGRIAGIPFALKIHTNITQDHLDYHKTFERYRETKCAFFDDEAPKLLNSDDPEIRFNPKNASTYAVEKAATFKVDSFSLRGGISAVVTYRDERATFYSEMSGFFNLYNLTAALGALRLLTTATLEQAAEALENFGGVAGRMEVVSREPLVIVDFAHTPDGMLKVIETMKESPVVVLFGAGGDRDADKRPKMGHIAATMARRVYVTSDNPRSEEPQAIIEAILEGVPPEFAGRVQVEIDRKKAIERALDELQEDETLLLLGKGDETTQTIGSYVYPFDDRQIARDYLAKKEGE